MDYLRVLIADDEQATRTALRSLRWEQHGCVLAGEAEDGQQVLDILAHTAVDVILLDIGMPIMNGLELAPIILKHYPNVKIVFLTMHREFDYAVDAMRLKAFDYLIKDFSNPSRLFSTLTRLQIEKQQESAVLRMRQEEILNKRMKNLTAEPLPRSRPVRMVRLIKKETLIEYPLLYIERRLLQLPGCDACQPIHEQEWLIFGCEDDDSLLYHMQEEWGEAFHVTVSLEGCTDVLSAVQKGNNYLKEGFYFPERRMLTDSTYVQEFSGSLMNKFQSDIHACFYDVTQDSNILNDWLIRCAQMHIAPSAVKRLLITLISTNIAGQMDPSSLISSLWNACTASEVVALFRSYLLKARLAGGEHRIEIQRVKAYIHANLNNDLGMKSLSKQVGVSPNYLNKLFREDMNESLKNYVTRIRMETAAKMLKNTDMRINEIAVELGYRTSRYFSDVFSKYYGVTPTDYRRG